MAVSLKRDTGAGPVTLADVELADPLTALGPCSDEEAAPGRRARLLVRLHGRPLGVVDVPIPAGGLEPKAQAAAIWTVLSEPIKRHLDHDGRQALTAIPIEGIGDQGRTSCSWASRLGTGAPPRAAAVITTCRATDQLARTIRTALRLDYPDFEVLVVDNRPATSGVERFLAHRFAGVPRLRYVAETRPGLSSARNAGLHATQAEVVAFTDDDVVLDESWLSWLVAGFRAADRVACVTGLIVPLELAAPAQLFFEEFGGFTKGYEVRVWDRELHRLDHPLYPYTVGLYGSGANAAFRRELLLQLGGFDARLGAGTPARGGEDLDIYTRVVLSGHRLVYEPAALLRHSHRSSVADLERQISDYGVGLSAMLTKHLVEDRRTRREVLRRLPAGVAHAFSPRSPKHANKTAGYPLRLTLIEFAGMAYGPVGYLRSRLSR